MWFRRASLFRASCVRQVSWNSRASGILSQSCPLWLALWNPRHEMFVNPVDLAKHGFHRERVARVPRGTRLLGRLTKPTTAMAGLRFFHPVAQRCVSDLRTSKCILTSPCCPYCHTRDREVHSTRCNDSAFQPWWKLLNLFPLEVRCRKYCCCHNLARCKIIAHFCGVSR